MKQPRRLVYIDTKSNYYARYAGKDRTHAFVATEHVDPLWVELLRVKPEEWDDSSPKEAA